MVKHRRKDKKTAESKLVAAAKDIWRETDKKVTYRLFYYFIFVVEYLQNKTRVKGRIQSCGFLRIFTDVRPDGGLF